MAKLIDGKKISSALLEKVSKEVSQSKKYGVEPCLAVILVGDDPASKIYVRNKKRTCEAVGIKSLEYILPKEITEAELLSLIWSLNNDSSVHGILCQLPLPSHIDKKTILTSISPDKDVDAFHPKNVGHIVIGDAQLLPCTPAGVMEMLRYEGISVEGKNCVVIGRSDIVGKPMASLLLAQNGTVTVCHSKTPDLAYHTRQADILVCSVGKKNLISADMVKDGAVIIDVSINRNDDGTLCGDVIFDEVSKKASYITPVPGGVGPMTIAVLMQNTLTAARLQTIHSENEAEKVND